MANKLGVLNGESVSSLGTDKTVAELKAIKRLLALMLLHNGVPQKAVAKAAGVRLQTINEMAKGVAKPKKQAIPIDNN